MTKSTFDKIKAGLDDALDHARGKDSAATYHDRKALPSLPPTDQAKGLSEDRLRREPSRPSHKPQPTLDPRLRGDDGLFVPPDVTSSK